MKQTDFRNAHDSDRSENDTTVQDRPVVHNNEESAKKTHNCAYEWKQEDIQNVAAVQAIVLSLLFVCENVEETWRQVV